MRGEAGSGKTTLLRWLAVQTARGQLPTELAEWNQYVPFVIRLRDFTRKKLPDESDFVYFVKERVLGRQPNHWARRKLESGEALLLIDGVDELPPEKRDDVQQWVSNLHRYYPKSLIVISSRPEAIQEHWLEAEKFTDAMLLPMQDNDIQRFVCHWFDAVHEQIGEALPDPQGRANALLDRIREREALRQLAQNPLLCAALCALSRDRDDLPDDRMLLYERFIEMLLLTRDHAREIKGRIDYNVKLAILSRLAYWMLENADPDNPVFIAEIEDAKRPIKTVWESMNRSSNDAFEDDFQDLMERSGLLRKIGSDRIEFSHRTLGEYLAASQFVAQHGEISLARHTGVDLWHETIIFTVGYANKYNQEVRDSLIRRLIEQAEKQNERSVYLLLLSCLEHKSLQLTAEFQRAFQKAIPKVLPLEETKEALIVSRAGSWAIEYLHYDKEWMPEQAGFVIEALIRIGTFEAFDVLQSFSDYQIFSPDVGEPLINFLFRNHQNFPYQNISGFISSFVKLLGPLDYKR